jgi:hypothetical protein
MVKPGRKTASSSPAMILSQLMKPIDAKSRKTVLSALGINTIDKKENAKTMHRSMSNDNELNVKENVFSLL